MSGVLDETGARVVRKAAEADLKAQRKEFIFQCPTIIQKSVIHILSETRDLPIFYLFFNIVVTTLPAAALLFRFAPASHLAGASYLITNYVLFLQRFMLALHYSEHRKLFRRNSIYGKLLNLVAPLILAPFFGIPSGMYRLHHCVMHHVGNNHHTRDGSSTEPYQRNNILHFIVYWARHAFLGPVEIPLRAALNKRWRLLAACLVTEGSYCATVSVLFCTAPVATLYVFILPYAISSIALMFGNWSQHIFIDPRSPRSNFSLTYNCAGCADNQLSFNDGYHIVHHSNSVGVHWQDLPLKFIDTLEEHGRAEALVFLGIGFFDVGAAVVSGRFQFLAKHVARYTKKLAAMSDEEIVSELKRRLQPIRYFS